MEETVTMPAVDTVYPGVPEAVVGAVHPFGTVTSTSPPLSPPLAAV
jgi:hypothetical protein